MEKSKDILSNEKIMKQIEVIISKYDIKYHEDLRQELYLKTIEILNSDKNINNIESYLFITLKNKAIKYVKQESQKSEYIEFDEKKDYHISYQHFNFSFMSYLSKIEKSVFVYYFICGYSKKEIANKLNTYPKKVNLIIEKIKNKLFSLF